MAHDKCFQPLEAAKNAGKQRTNLIMGQIKMANMSEIEKNVASSQAFQLIVWHVKQK